MGVRGLRADAPIAATIVTAGTDGSLTAPRLLQFQDGRGNTISVKHCLVVNNMGGEILRIKLNTTVANDFDNDTDDDGPGHLFLADNTPIDVSLNGDILVHSVTLASEGASNNDLDDVSVVGWK